MKGIFGAIFYVQNVRKKYCLKIKLVYFPDVFFKHINTVNEQESKKKRILHAYLVKGRWNWFKLKYIFSHYILGKNSF